MSDTYNKQVKKVAVEYRNRAMAVLTAIKQELDKSALVINGPSDLSGDEYIWSMCAFSPAVEFGHGPLVDITVTICESRDYQGTEGGINFRLRAEAVNDNGTTVLGECAPYNFTPDVWVPLDQPEAIEARFALIEEMPAAETAKLVMDYLLPNRRRSFK